MVGRVVFDHDGVSDAAQPGLTEAERHVMLILSL